MDRLKIIEIEKTNPFINLTEGRVYDIIEWKRNGKGHECPVINDDDGSWLVVTNAKWVLEADTTFNTLTKEQRRFIKILIQWLGVKKSVVGDDVKMFVRVEDGAVKEFTVSSIIGWLEEDILGNSSYDGYDKVALRSIREKYINEFV